MLLTFYGMQKSLNALIIHGFQAFLWFSTVKDEIIAYLGRNVKDYYRENILRYLEVLELTCPKCGSRTVYHATYERHVHIDEIVEWLTIQRVICDGCGGTHAIIPDFIRPYKHYSTCDSEMSLRDVDDGVPVEQVRVFDTCSNIEISTSLKNRAFFIGKMSNFLHFLLRNLA